RNGGPCQSPILQDREVSPQRILVKPLEQAAARNLSAGGAAKSGYEPGGDRFLSVVCRVTLRSERSRLFRPAVITVLYLGATGMSCVPMLQQPDSPLSGVIAFVLTLPWSVVLTIPIARLWPRLMSTL